MDIYGIQLRMRADEDGCHVTVRARNADFAGVGEAWFDPDALQEFAAALATYPLEGSPQLTGGYGGSGDGSIAPQDTIYLRAYRVGRRGQIGVRVVLESTVWQNTRPEESSRVELEILTSYVHLGNFAISLLNLSTANSGEAWLQEDKL